jgi:bacteriocin-like protein
MKPTEIKQQKLSLNKKSISNLTETEMKNIQGGLVTKPTNTVGQDTVTDGFPITFICPTTIVLTADTKPNGTTF